MNFNLKYLVILSNIISMFICNNYCACTENNCISTDKNNLNSNTIKQQNSDEFLNIKYEDKTQIQNFLTESYDKVQQVSNNTIKKTYGQILNKLLTNPYNVTLQMMKHSLKTILGNIPAIKFLTDNLFKIDNSTFVIQYTMDASELYTQNEILDLLKSFDNWNLNEQLTFEQLKEIYNITKAINFLFSFTNQQAQLEEQLKKQVGKQREYENCISLYFNVDFVIEDKNFGICINSTTAKDSGVSKNKLFKSIIFDRNETSHMLSFILALIEKGINNDIPKISGKSLHNFLYAVKLCSTKKLPISFFDKKGEKCENPCLITNNDYKALLESLLKDFIYVFTKMYYYIYHYITKPSVNDIKRYYENCPDRDCAYCHNQVDEVYDDAECFLNENNKIMEQHIKNTFTNKYNEEDLIKIFGKTTIDNVRYVIYLLIDNKMHSNNNELLNRLNDILIDIIENNTRDESLKSTYENLREKITYENMRRSTSTVQEIFDNIMNYIINNKELKDLFDTLKDEVYDKIIDDEISNNIMRDIQKYSCNDNINQQLNIAIYLSKLLYYSTLRSYIIMHSLFPIIKSNKFISSKKKEYNEIKNKKKVDNHNKLINDINSEYVTKVVFDFIQKKRLKQILFAEAENNNLKNNKSNKKDISSKIINNKFDVINNNDQKEYNESNIILQNTILQKKHERDQKEYESDEESEEESEEEDIFYETNNKKMKNKDNNNNDFSNKLIRSNLNQINNITEINDINNINAVNNASNISNTNNTNNFNNANNINITTNNSNNINDINNKTNTINNEIFNNK